MKYSLKTLLGLAALASYSINATLGPLAGLISVGAATAATAHHWYKLLKPFKNDAERQEALKDIILNESTFAHHWTKKHYEEIKQNPELFKIEKASNSAITELEDGTIYLFLSLDDLSSLNIKTNRIQLKKELYNSLVTLGHEGAHIAQGIKNISHVGAYGLSDYIFWGQFLTRKLPKIHFDKSNTLSTPLAGSFLVRPGAITETRLMGDPNFQAFAHELYTAIEEYNRAYQRHSDIERLLESSKSDYIRGLRIKQLERTIIPAQIKMNEVAHASKKVAQYIEADADIQAIDSIFDTDIITVKQKLAAFSQQQTFFHKGDQGGYQHPPSSLRIEMLEMAKQHLMPLIALEYGAESMSKFWDPAAA